MITGGSFTGSIVGDVEEDGRLTKAEKAIADLVGNATDKTTTLFGLLTMSLVTVSAADTPESCKAANNYFYVNLGDNTYTCANDSATALSRVEEGKTAEIKVLRDFSVSAADVTLDKNVIYDLDGHTVTINSSYGYKVEGVNVTFRNGTLKVGSSKSGYVFSVNSANKESKLTLDVKVESDDTHPFIKVTNAAKATEVNISNEWKVKAEIIDCVNGEDEKLTVNFNKPTVKATFGAQSAIATLDAGTTTLNVNGGTYTSNKHVFVLSNGTLNIATGSTIKSTRASAIVVDETTGDYTSALTINGGTVSTEVGYALYFNGTKGAFNINDGKFTSGKDAKKKQLPAIYISNPEFLDNHKGMIKKGEFTGAIVGDVTLGDDVYKEAAAAQAILVGNATVKE